MAAMGTRPRPRLAALLVAMAAMATMVGCASGEVLGDVPLDGGDPSLTGCPIGQAPCGADAACVDVSADRDNCGLCGNRCRDYQACSASRCVGEGDAGVDDDASSTDSAALDPGDTASAEVIEGGVTTDSIPFDGATDDSLAVDTRGEPDSGTSFDSGYVHDTPSYDSSYVHDTPSYDSSYVYDTPSYDSGSFEYDSGGYDSGSFEYDSGAGYDSAFEYDSGLPYDSTFGGSEVTPF